MFTVKHIGQNGAETMVECESFAREKRSDGFFQYTAHHKPCFDNYDYVATWCGDENSTRNLSLGARQTIYVMNRFGATVATYGFVEADHTLAYSASTEQIAA